MGKIISGTSKRRRVSIKTLFSFCDLPRDLQLKWFNLADKYVVDYFFTAESLTPFQQERKVHVLWRKYFPVEAAAAAALALENNPPEEESNGQDDNNDDGSRRLGRPRLPTPTIDQTRAVYPLPQRNI
jgi:hypothetical protein